MRAYCILTRTVLVDTAGYTILLTGFIVIRGETFNVALKQH